MNPIAFARTPFKEKFGIPRQSGLVHEAEGILEFISPYAHPDAFRDLENYDHLWLIFQFHQIPEGEWSPLVRPPRLGGNVKKGVFATRSPFRPNRLGLSLVKLKEVIIDGGKAKLRVSGIDLLDQTPIFDIKPYLPDLECIPEAKDSWRKDLAHQVSLEIIFSATAEKFFKERESGNKEMQLIKAILQQDPRPGHKRSAEQIDHSIYGMKLFNFDVRWTVEEERITVVEIAVDQLS